MKLTMTMSLLLFFAIVSAQHVGVNKTNPAQPLDVGGNVNVDGNLLIDGTAGKAGEVLTTNSAGSTVWANFGDFKYVVSFTENSNFTVPAGVTKILIEAWGGGGGGSTAGGGGAGMYIISVQDVTPGKVIDITIGVGGLREPYGSGTGGSNGTSTTLISSGPFEYLQALSGVGASNIAPGDNSLLYSVGRKVCQFPGQHGFANKISYEQKNATTFVSVISYGEGGAAGPDYSRRSQGETRVLNESSGIQTAIYRPAGAPFPAGGGGGGNLAQNGANGMVNIRY